MQAMYLRVHIAVRMKQIAFLGVQNPGGLIRMRVQVIQRNVAIYNVTDGKFIHRLVWPRAKLTNANCHVVECLK